MVVAPVDAEKNKTQSIAEEYGNQGAQRGQTGLLRHFQFKHHDGDEDGDHAVAEGFQSSLTHLVKASRLDHSALGAGQWVKDDERAVVEVFYDCPYFADLQPGDDAVQDVLFGAAHAAVTLEDRHAPTKVPYDPFADRGIQIRHDRDGRVLIDAIQHEVERCRSGNVCEDGVQRCIDAQHRHGDQKQCHIEPEDHVPYS